MSDKDKWPSGKESKPASVLRTQFRVHPLESMDVQRFKNQSLVDEFDNQDEDSKNFASQVNMDIMDEINNKTTQNTTNDIVVIPWNQRRNPILGREEDPHHVKKAQSQQKLRFLSESVPLKQHQMVIEQMEQRQKRENNLDMEKAIYLKEQELAKKKKLRQREIDNENFLKMQIRHNSEIHRVVRLQKCNNRTTRDQKRGANIKIMRDGDPSLDKNKKFKKELDKFLAATNMRIKFDKKQSQNEDLRDV